MAALPAVLRAAATPPCPGARPPALTRRRRLAAIAALLLCLGAAGCSARKVAYNLAEPLLRRMLDQVLSLRPEQERLLQPRLHELLRWHRHSELPVYAERLAALRGRLGDGDGLSQEDLRWGKATMEELFGRVARRVTPDAAELLVTLSPAQLDRAEREGHKREKKRDEVYRLPAARYAQERTDEMERNIERWMGPLLPAQRAVLWRHLEQSYADARLRHEASRRQERELYQLLRRGLPAGDLAGELLLRLTRDQTTLSDAERAAERRIEGHLDELALEVFALSTPAQRQRLDRELAQLGRELTELSQGK